jgi:hypothetical protein
MLMLTIAELEQAINRSIKAEPPQDGVLPPDLRAMAEVYGNMIYSKAHSVDVDQQPAHIQLAVRKWLPSSQAVSPGSACTLQAGDPGIESCEACQ